jgi:hypothetical protein
MRGNVHQAYILLSKSNGDVKYLSFSLTTGLFASSPLQTSLINHNTHHVYGHTQSIIGVLKG